MSEFELDIKKMKALRRTLHQYPEISGEEKETANRIKEFLAEYKPDEIITDIGGHGLAAVYDSGKEGPKLMFRAELDALPIADANDVEYKSKNKGKGHKCGHDGHMTMVASLAPYLVKNKPRNGKVILLFQPAEETGEGAKRVMKDKKFKKIEPDYIFALHNLPGFTKSKILVRDAVFSSASVGMEIKLKGETSHAAHPENAKSPAVAVSQLIQGLMTIPQIHTRLERAALITVIHAKLGEISYGTTPGYAEVRATLRTHTNKDMKTISTQAIKLVNGIAKVYDLETEISWVEDFPATVNDGNCNNFVIEACDAEGIVSDKLDTPLAWSEDFGNYLLKYKGALFGLGAGKDAPQLHNANYDFSEDLISIGHRVFRRIIKQLCD